MDTNNLDKWWYGLPENTRQAIGDDGIWEKLDMPSRSALHRYSLLRIYGTAKDRDEERTLLNEIALSLIHIWVRTFWSLWNEIPGSNH